MVWRLGDVEAGCARGLGAREGRGRRDGDGFGGDVGGWGRGLRGLGSSRGLGFWLFLLDGGFVVFAVAAAA